MLFFPHVLSVRQEPCKFPRIRLVSIISVLCFHLNGSYIIYDKTLSYQSVTLFLR